VSLAAHVHGFLGAEVQAGSVMVANASLVPCDAAVPASGAHQHVSSGEPVKPTLVQFHGEAMQDLGTLRPIAGDYCGVHVTLGAPLEISGVAFQLRSDETRHVTLPLALTLDAENRTEAVMLHFEPIGLDSTVTAARALDAVAAAMRAP